MFMEMNLFYSITLSTRVLFGSFIFNFINCIVLSSLYCENVFVVGQILKSSSTLNQAVVSVVLNQAFTI